MRTLRAIAVAMGEMQIDCARCGRKRDTGTEIRGRAEDTGRERTVAKIAAVDAASGKRGRGLSMRDFA